MSENVRNIDLVMKLMCFSFIDIREPGIRGRQTMPRVCFNICLFAPNFSKLVKQPSVTNPAPRPNKSPVWSHEPGLADRELVFSGYLWISQETSGVAGTITTYPKLCS